MEFYSLCQIFDKIEQESSRLKIRDLLISLFEKLLKSGDFVEAGVVAYLLTGKLVPGFVPIEMGIKDRTIEAIISRELGISADKIKEFVQTHGDHGMLWYTLTKEKDFASSHKQANVYMVYSKLMDIAVLSGPGSYTQKQQMLTELLKSVSPLEGKYIIRISLQRLRLGVSRLGLLDALAHLAARHTILKNTFKNAFGKKFAEHTAQSDRPAKSDTNIVKPAQIKSLLTYVYGVNPDVGYIAQKLLQDAASLLDITLTPTVPVAPQLAEREKDIDTIFSRIPAPFLEPKYDGLRGQLHLRAYDADIDLKDRIWYPWYEKVTSQTVKALPGMIATTGAPSPNIKLYSRNLEDLTPMFPELYAEQEKVQKALKQLDANYVTQYITSHLDAWVEQFLDYLDKMQQPEWARTWTKTTRVTDKTTVKNQVLQIVNFMTNGAAETGGAADAHGAAESGRVAELSNAVELSGAAESRGTAKRTGAAKPSNTINLHHTSKPALVFDSEIIGYDINTDTFLPFQQTITRRRKYDINQAATKVPVKLFVFDIMFWQHDLLHLPFFIRRQLINHLFDKILTDVEVLVPAPEHYIDFMDKQTAKNLFLKYVEAGLEGVMFKDRLAPYEPGQRTYSWIKYKRAMKQELADSIDAVVLGYYYGKGRRAQLGIGAMLLGVYDDKNDKFVTISKLGTGMTDQSLKDLKQVLDKNKAYKQPNNVNIPKDLKPDVYVYPDVVVEVEADEITKSPVHSAGWALRFPRFKRVREKQAQDATKLNEILEMVKLNDKK